MTNRQNTSGGRKNKGPAFSAGQCPSLACNDDKKLTPLLNAFEAVSLVSFLASSTFTEGIACLNFFSFKNCNNHSMGQGQSETAGCASNKITMPPYWSLKTRVIIFSYLL